MKKHRNVRNNLHKHNWLLKRREREKKEKKFTHSGEERKHSLLLGRVNSTGLTAIVSNAQHEMSNEKMIFLTLFTLCITLIIISYYRGNGRFTYNVIFFPLSQQSHRTEQLTNVSAHHEQNVLLLVDRQTSNNVWDCWLIHIAFAIWIRIGSCRWKVTGLFLVFCLLFFSLSLSFHLHSNHPTHCVHTCFLICTS